MKRKKSFRKRCEKKKKRRCGRNSSVLVFMTLVIPEGFYLTFCLET